MRCLRRSVLLQLCSNSGQQLAGDRRLKLVLGVETIFARHQHILEEWWRREIEEEELRQRIRFDLDWNYDWPPFYELLVTAREHADAVYGLDCEPRQDLRKIKARDQHAADKIAEIHQRHSNAVILVLFGESHLAPGHLPRVECAGGCRSNGCLPCCKTWTRFTGRRPEPGKTGSRPFA